MKIDALSHSALRILMLCRNDSTTTMPEMARRLGVTEPVIVAACHKLMKAGYLAGRRGRGGGYRLARPAESVLVVEIFNLFRCQDTMFNCTPEGGLPCPLLMLCRLRRVSESAYQAFIGELSGLTLADVAYGEFRD